MEQLVSENKPLKQATSLLSELWFPFDLGILQNISSNLELKSYANNREFYINELKKDISLFMLCLKELSLILSEKKSSSDFVNDYFNEADDTDFEKAVIRLLNNRNSRHSLDKATDLQKQRMLEMYVSSCAVQELSESIFNDSSSVGSMMTYSCSLLRQLGLTLIAWNYPQVYEKVASTKHTRNSLDEALRSHLGYTPGMLGFSIAYEWNISPEYLNIIVMDQEDEVFKNKVSEISDIEIQKRAEAILSVCKIGEIFSRTMNPDLYELSLEDKNQAESYILKNVGKDGVSKLIIATKELLKESRLKSLISVLDDNIRIVEDAVKQHDFADSYVSKNNYLQFVPKKIFPEIRKLYKEMAVEEVAVEKCMSIFTKEVLPKMIFSTFIVYLHDPFRDQLFPSLRIGSPVAHQVNKCFPAKNRATYSIVSAGFGLKSALREDRLNDDDNGVIMLANSLGSDPAIGVLYAEVPISEESTSLDVLAYFKACKIILTDCLGITD